MGQVAEFLIAEGIVAQILNHRASVRVGMSLLDLLIGNARETLDQERSNLRFPCQVYDLLVRQTE